MQNFAHFLWFCALKVRIMMKKIAILASGNGTNAENIIRYFRGRGTAEVSLVLTNRSTAYVLQRAAS